MEESETIKAATCPNSLVLAVNGERFELPSVDPSTTLLEFLRSHTRFKSVKLGCGQGGCGACVVLLSKYDPDREQVENFPVNSCLVLLCSVNGCSITTSEGIGNSKDGFHPIHKRFAGFHASQCGFCTPGMCMSLFSALVNAEKKDRPEPPPGFSKLTVSEAEKAISGNLCRCTGYRPIADACKSFAADVDMEDLGINSFWKKGEIGEVKESRLPFYSPNNQNCIYPEYLKDEFKSAMPLDSRRYSWCCPSTVEELQGLLEINLAEKGKRTRLVVGNTGMGYYPELRQYDKYIDLRYIPQLSMVKRERTGIEIGAAVTISKAIISLREENKDKSCSEDNLVFLKIADHMEKIASESIRNSATVGGNLVMAQRNYFPSDIATILLAVGTTVSILTGLKYEKLTLEEFLERPPLDSRSVLLSVQIPHWKHVENGQSTETDSKLLFETYRAAPRPLGNALPYLNAAFLADVSPCKTGVVVNKVQLAFGAYGTKHAIRAGKVEEYLDGKTLSIVVLYEALKLVRATVVPEDGISHSDYRSSLAVSYVFEFFGPFINEGAVMSNGLLDRCNGSLLEEMPKVNNNGDHFDLTESPALLSSAKQVVISSREYHPVGEPISKSGAAIQASGLLFFLGYGSLYRFEVLLPNVCLVLLPNFWFLVPPFPCIRELKLDLENRDV
ncbi:unnamed protein product [Ilex paraguariensis]|uniref:Uncharacterized protein n=1 Tax=Ilex paraguariensis TaxID=185542 RepID=A0ABC8S352_9AQUA